MDIMSWFLIIYMIIIDYIGFFISHVISTQDTRNSPRVEGSKAYMGRGYILRISIRYSTIETKEATRIG
jgi:hypothetical protein